MRAQSFSLTPFDEGKKAVKANIECVNPYEGGSVQHRNYELGRAFGIQHFKVGDGRRTFEPRA